MKIGYCGNFLPAFSTENERKWSFEQLGHDITEFQENKTTSKDLLEAMNSLDLLVFSHTHSPEYVIEGLAEVLGIYKANGIPTASAHLDRYAWLKRESDVANEDSWKCEYIFMADGSPEAVELYEKHKLNWYWLKPGVVERACYIAEPTPTFKHDIVFTGSRGYHEEYDMRPRLIDWLKRTYGEQFAHYGNDGIRVVRQGELNKLYASSKIVIGDSCFGGRPKYVSDRYYEVRGRGGFLLHPHVEGIDTVGVGNYKHGDFDDLKKQIDYYLTHNEERESMRIQGQNHVQENETYTHRCAEMIKVVFS